MKPTLAAIVLLALIDAARAADEARFYPPPGWTVTKQLGASMLTPPGVPAGKQCAAMILPDEQGEVNAVFATGWQNVAREWKIVSGGEPIAKRSKGGFETRSTTATALDAAEKSRVHIHLFAVQSGANVRRVLFLSDDQQVFEKHLQTQVRFLKDGHFKATGLQDCVHLDQLVYPDWPKLPAAGTGTYTIRRNTLEVKYDNDGPTRRMFFMTPDNPSNPKRISIANNPLEREP
jgi:hypothetical protein